ncbi:MAG: glucosaminidase domain-containing protein [Candidatus Levybacteria bacterium]|nr:glucosaminidase domain-containing protein [Candidatus Levybacteria bacterium]
MKKLLLLTSFFTFAPLFFLSIIIFFLFVTYQNRPDNESAQFFVSPKSVAYAALPTNGNLFEGNIESKDAREEMVRQFLARYNSPLEPYAKYIVEMAEKYNIDHRLIPAIAMQETNLCLKSRPESYNCWGLGVYGGKYPHFDNYSEAIEVVTKTLATKYKNSSLVSPEEIMTMYTPSSNGSWANSVNHFMDQLQ